MAHLGRHAPGGGAADRADRGKRRALAGVDRLRRPQPSLRDRRLARLDCARPHRQHALRLSSRCGIGARRRAAETCTAGRGPGRFLRGAARGASGPGHRRHRANGDGRLRAARARASACRIGVASRTCAYRTSDERHHRSAEAVRDRLRPDRPALRRLELDASERGTCARRRRRRAAAVPLVHALGQYLGCLHHHPGDVARSARGAARALHRERLAPACAALPPADQRSAAGRCANGPRCRYTAGGSRLHPQYRYRGCAVGSDDASGVRGALRDPDPALLRRHGICRPGDRDVGGIARPVGPTEIRQRRAPDRGGGAARA